MTISRANMDQQVRKPPMKKPVKKKNGGLLAMISPAAALAQSLRSGKPEGILGMGALGAMANVAQRRSRKRDDKKEGPSGPSSIEGPTGMKRGGKVGRGDGVCKKGRTKGKMV